MQILPPSACTACVTLRWRGISERQESFFGQTVTLGDRLCTTPFVQVAVSTCNLCMMNQDAGYKAAQYGVTANALRHGDTQLAARRTVGAMLALEPWEPNIGGFQNASSDVLQDSGDVGNTVTDQTDPCEDLELKL